MFVESKCNCVECVRMCERAPCLPLPSEAQKLIDAGYKDYLEVKIVKEVMLVSPKRALGDCIFLENRLCKLHDLGLKPLEGRVEIHDKVSSVNKFVIDAWKHPVARKLLKALLA